MSEDKYLDLVNREVDGLLTPEEKAELEKLIIQNPQVKSAHDDLFELSNLLSQAKSVEPSPNLKKNILNGIPKNMYGKGKAQRSGQTLLSRILNVDFRLIYSFAGGLVVGLVLLSLARQEFGADEIDPSDLTGTIILSGRAKGFQLAEKLEIALSDVTGSIESKFSENVVVVEIDLITENETDLTLLFDYTDLLFKGFRHDKPSTANLAFNHDTLKLTLTAANKYSLVFQNETARLSDIAIKIVNPSGNYERNIATGLAGE